jgi:hypothetical protein
VRRSRRTSLLCSGGAGSQSPLFGRGSYMARGEQIRRPNGYRIRAVIPSWIGIAAVMPFDSRRQRLRPADGLH